MIWPHVIAAYPGLKAEAQAIRSDLLDAELVRYDANMGIDYGRDCIQTSDIGDRCGKEAIKNAEVRERERELARTADMIERVLVFIEQDARELSEVVRYSTMVYTDGLLWEDVSRLSGYPVHALQRAYRRYNRQ